jgi:DNA (cytosine-5)-methyltransferase 1
MSEIHHNLLETIYAKLIKKLELNGYIANPEKALNFEIVKWINMIVNNSERFLGVLNVTITSLAEKSINPDQDIRKHQAKMTGGYSGRTLDTKTIAPWLKSKKLPSMRESGWLTRSLEQDSPYTLDYRGAIRDKDVKNAFLHLLDSVEKKIVRAEDCLYYLIQLLIIQREQNNIQINPLTKKSKYSLEEIIYLVSSHFEKVNQAGTARLPVLAVYSVYQIMIDELSRYKDCILQPLGYHASSDLRSGDIGDIQINSKDEKPYEGIEIKYGKLIDHVLIEDAFEKIKLYPVNRYYLLSTKLTSGEELVKIKEIINEVKEKHGCEIIVNGLIPSIKYYLRLINDSDQFLKNYTENLINDSAIKIEHKTAWKRLLEE